MADPVIPSDPTTHEDSESPSEEQKETLQAETARKYLDLIKDREKAFETGWWKTAKNSSNIYAQPAKNPGEKMDIAYNILYSNTEVLLPSLYSSTAKPDIRGRFKDTSIKPIPEVCERFLIIATDGTQPGAESFDQAVKSCVLSSLTAASGVIRLRLYEEQEFPLQFESIPYDSFLWGKAKKWARVPWVAFKHELSKEELQSQFKLPADEVEENYKPSSDNEGKKSSGCIVYEFWHKLTKTVWFISEEWDDLVIQTSPDPMGLKSFFPTPGLMMMTQKANDLEPIPLYEYYRNQAEELNRVTVRLNKVLSAIRVRGVYNSLLGQDLQKMLADGETENMLAPAEEAGLLAQSGGLDKHIWMLPIDKLVAVAQQLYTSREAIKQVIYELTGISDIIRGSNVASETATATNTKNKWGTVRLRQMQTLVADYIRDLFRMAIDCGSSKIPAQLWQKLIQLTPPLPLQQEQDMAKMQLQHTVQVSQMMGQPPSPPDPAMVQMLQSPTMEQILEKISSDVDRTFTINIQSSSTVDLDTAQDKGEVQEFMNALAQLLAGLQPLAAMGPSGMAAAKAIVVSVCKRYKFGLEIVDAIEGIQPPPPPQPEQKGPPPPSPAEQQANDMIHQAKMQEAQFSMQEAAAKHEVAMANIELEKAKIEAAHQQLAIDQQMAEIKISSARIAANASQQTAAVKVKNANLPTKV